MKRGYQKLRPGTEWSEPFPSASIGAGSLGSDRRVRGREAIACDAEGALDAPSRWRC
jgi:hypothetical protein